MQQAGSLAGRVAIITGAAQGIGAQYAHALAAAGASVTVADVQDTQPVAQAIVAAGGQALAVKADVTDPVSVRGMVAATIEHFGKVDILINNAALFGNVVFKPFEELESAEWERMMTVNVRGVFECCKAVSPAMRKNGYGKIVNIASAIVFKGAPMMLHYVASKGAIIAMTRSLARELGNDGIRVNSLAPGLVMSENVLANPAWKGAVVDNNVASRALKRDATPEDMTGTVIYLCSEASDFVTGQVLVVDGGSIMH
jgi:NAD(P)-dependent dehydrogenase (short-subunit alcohol dehydrogenase family)